MTSPLHYWPALSGEHPLLFLCHLSSSSVVCHLANLLWWQTTIIGCLLFELTQLYVIALLPSALAVVIDGRKRFVVGILNGNVVLARDHISLHLFCIVFIECVMFLSCDVPSSFHMRQHDVRHCLNYLRTDHSIHCAARLESPTSSCKLGHICNTRASIHDTTVTAPQFNVHIALIMIARGECSSNL
jgi:hypothetical protein